MVNLVAYMTSELSSSREKNSQYFTRSLNRNAFLALFFLCLSPLAQAQQYEDIDPLEGINRDIYAFNSAADRNVIKPIARAYQWVMPDVAERGVDRFFDNLQELGSAVNNLAQGKGSAAVNNTGRFLVNSTIGILGFMDVADDIGLEKEDFEDFGQTLAVWGVDSGPYLMLPFLGPSTLRDAPAIFVDSQLQPQNYLEDAGARNAARALNIVSIRAQYMDADQALPENDPYSFIRDAFMQRREYLIQDGQVQDDFGAESSGDFLD